MRALALINQSAGAVARSGDIEKLVRDGFAKRGIHADVKLVAGHQIGEMAQGFVAERPRSGDRRVLVVGGGDGTLGSATSALAGTNVALGVLPLGTLNHFAKDLGVPIELDAAMDAIAANKPVTVDVAEVNGRVFLNNSSIGIYPFFVAKRSAEQERRGLGKLAAIGPALARTVRSASWQAVHVAAQGNRERLLTPCVFVGNNFYDIGDLGRRKSLSSHELSVYVVKQQSWFGLALLPFKIAFGLIDATRDVETYRTKALQITSHRAAMLVSLDGEAISMDMPLNFRIRPAALQVLSPTKMEPD
ncbi:diacylglycerol/lipid kinase family protein [Mesorhizobium carmichaelinearum]|uniref:diacylglycerol/lipid kinase family protein n=1 Tax=Mesorhizobium carmichaelinearum TaxID=1208188 RepID=UPI000BA4B15B|nr:diacylglycerol kinase family protein [Mesorhizobium carmichaelinearum]